MSEFKLTSSLSYTNLFSLAKDIYLYPGRFYKAFKEKDLMKFIQEQDTKKYDAIIELKKKHYIPDVFLFKVSYILNPFMELRYHGFLFKDYAEIGKIIKKNSPKIDVYIKDLIRFDLLQEYMEKQDDDKKKPETYKKVLMIREKYKYKHNLGYFLLGYALDHDKTFYYNGEKFTDPKVFLKSRSTMHNLFKFARDFEVDCAFMAWLEVMEQTSIINRYNGVVKLIENKEKECLNSEQVNDQNENSDPLILFYKEFKNG